MLNVSRKALLVLAVFAIALLGFSLVASFFPGSVVAVLLGIYVVVALRAPFVMKGPVP
jgi:hypothetical protein